MNLNHNTCVHVCSQYHRIVFWNDDDDDDEYKQTENKKKHNKKKTDEKQKFTVNESWSSYIK